MSSFAGDRSFFRKSPVAKHGFKPSTSVHIAHDKKTKLALHKIASNNGRHSYLTTQSVDEFLREEAKQTYGEKMRKRKETQEQLKREREMRIKAQREQSRAKFEASREKRQKEKQPEKRQKALSLLVGIEEQVWVRIDNGDKIFAIADEDLDRSTSEKTSSVHFLRFELLHL